LGEPIIFGVLAVGLGWAAWVDTKDLAMIKKEFNGDWSSYPQVGMKIGDNGRLIQLSQQRVF